MNYRSIKNYLIITVGLFLNAFAWAAFLIPHQIVGGGISGIGLLIYSATGLPVGVTFFIANIFLIGIAIKILGSKFGAKTIYGIIALSAFLSVLQKLIPNALVQDPFMATLIGGAIAGSGIGIAFTQGGSTGGTDIIAMIINKFHNISPGRVILTIDIFIISSSFIVFNSIEKIIYGFVCMAVATYSIDMILNGSRESVQVTIISRHYSEIANKIGKEMNRGVTLLNGRGWYSNENIEVVMTMIHKSQAGELMRIVSEVDKQAFVSMARVMGVYGKGFEQLRQ
ncbi:MAG TPA: YitT family protein [Candidatus Cloacimonadota bacterium]|nr:YitT family protein [Candidatus Cloacimonadota bacterium]